MSAITAKASRKMKKYAVLTREPRCFLGSFDFSWEQRKLGEVIRLNGRIGFRGYTEKDIVSKDDGGVLTFSPTNIVDNKLTTNCKNTYITRFKYDESPEIKIHNGDILFVKTGSTLGKSALVTGLSEDATLNPQVVVMRTNNLNVEFLAAMLVTNAIISQVNSAKIGGAVPTLTETRIKDFDVAIPVSEAEKEQIGQFFSQLDNLITLHQRKCALLFSSFQALISMMFTTSTFSWEQRKFEEIAVRSSVICSDDTLPRVEYEDIVSGTGRLNKDIYAKQSIKSGIAFHQGDVLYGKLRPYLQNWLLPTFDGLAVGDFWVLQPQNADSSFLYRLIQSRQFDEVANQSTGTKMPRADWKLVSKTVFSIPSNISEQAAIGTYFTALDSLITLHQRKCISFTGRAGRLILTANKKRTTSSWEQRKVGDLLIERNQQAPMSDEYPLMAFIANEGVAPKGERYDRSALVTDTVNKLYKKTEKGDFIYSSNNLETGSIGLNKYGKACISPVYSIFEPTGIADSDFLGRRLVRKDFINAMVKWRQGVIYGQWRIHESDFLKIEITVPSVEEQRKIGTYLDQLDHLITLHQRKPFLMKWRTSDANRNQTNRLVL